MTTTADELREVIENNAVVVFSKTTCPYCVKAKQLLQEKGIEYHEVIANREQLNELETMTGQGSVPNIWIKGTFIGGCNDGPEDWMGLSKCIRTGKFEELLQA